MRPPDIAPGRKGRMYPTTLDTLRCAARHPGTWLLILVGAFVAWCGLSLGILALGDQAAQAQAVIRATAQTFAVVVTLWVLALALEQDADSDLARAADATAPGPVGRSLGRWAGSVLAGITVGWILQGGLQVATGWGPYRGADLSLYIAIIIIAAHVGAWGLLFGAVAERGSILVPGFLLWVAGHLPWGSPALLPGWGGRALAIWLPTPSSGTADPASRVAAEVLTVCGLLALAVATRCRPTPTRWLGRRTGTTPPSATHASLPGPR